jgi:hypothetical protein
MPDALDPARPDVPRSGGAPPLASEAPVRRRSRLRRVGLALLVAVPVAAIGLWIAIHRVEWLGPWLADRGRAIVGNDAIAKLEDWAYGVQDEVNQATRKDEKPVAYWEVPPTDAPPTPAKGARYPSFAVKNVPPMHDAFAAPGDGVWVPVSDAREPGEPAPLLKTLLHPDPKRGWSHVAVVAVDLRQVRLSLVAGTMEPMSRLTEAKAHARPGRIPESDVPRALAAFNGGFKTTHGNYGMKAEGALFVEPRTNACTVAAYAGDVVRIGGWEKLEPTRTEMVWFRQTPACMFDDGVMHKGLAIEENTMWGATLDKNTVIRRSAIGLGADGSTLYVGISDATTAAAIARAMHHAGAHAVAQLDVNWSYPKFVTVEPEGGDAANAKVKAIIDGFDYTEDDYVRKPMARDFFYLSRKALESLPAPSASGSASSAAPSPSVP